VHDRRRESAHEPGTCSRRHPQRGLRPHLRWQTPELGRQWPALRGLGDVPPEGLPSRSEPDVRASVVPLVRPADPDLALRRHHEGSLADTDSVDAGVVASAIFKTTDGGQSWQELPGLREHGTGPNWQPGAGGLCLHTLILYPSKPDRMFIAISAAGAFRTDDGG